MSLCDIGCDLVNVLCIMYIVLFTDFVMRSFTKAVKEVITIKGNQSLTTIIAARIRATARLQRLKPFKEKNQKKKKPNKQKQKQKHA